MGVTFNPLAAQHPIIAVLATLTLLLNMSMFFAAVYYLLSKIGYRSDLVEKNIKRLLRTYYREISLLLVATATSGSLYMSNILKWTPCRLCWFQRIFIYPIVVLVAVGILFDDKNVRDYVLPLTIIGLPIALYHALIQRFEQFQSAGCSVLSVSCSTKYTFFYGYVTVPVMAVTVLLSIAVLMWRFSEKSS